MHSLIMLVKNATHKKNYFIEIISLIDSDTFTSKTMAILADQRLRAFDQISDNRLLSLYKGQPFAGAIDVKKRV